MNLTYKNKNEKGSITVYVVVSMLFILIVLTIIYMSMVNKSINQEKKIARIQEEYNKSTFELLLLMKDQYHKIMYKTNLNEDEIKELENSGIKELRLEDNEIENTTIKGSLQDNNDESIRAVITGEVPIPKGFYYVGGTEDEGIVISDNDQDSGKGTDYSVTSRLKGNQFVWIPVEVENEQEFASLRHNGYYSEGLLDITIYPNCTEPYASGYSSESTEYNDMKTSVTIYKGFYVARYEAGKENENELVSKQGKEVWNNIKWGESISNIGTSGAVYKSKQMYTGKPGFSIKSNLIYGVQWDAIMNWIDNKYKTGNCNINSYVVLSSGKGVYEQNGSPSVTGSDEKYAKYNIYDLAGNVGEWTMEAYSTTSRVYRGGTYIQRGDFYPTSYRATAVPTTENDKIGFRVVLYFNIPNN